MYASLTGTVTAHLGSRTLIEVHGVGYWVHTGIWKPSGELTVYLHHQVREDANELFGFPDLGQLELFEKLISISGIGPKAGLGILSLGDVSALRQAIEAGDIKFLSQAPGIGQKAAQKIVLELRGKLAEETNSAAASVHGDLVSALEQLGYRRGEIIALLPELPSGLSLESQLPWMLQRL
jgi:holliday junction DNA helicase RuvA